LGAIADLQAPDEEDHLLGGKYGHLLQEVPPGQNYHHFTKEMGHPNPQFAWRSRFSDFLYKADPNAPVRTIVAKLGAYSGPFHWKNRKFTLDELKRLQSFPDDYRFTPSKGAPYQQIGNSVPPLFALALARAVKQQLFNCDLGVDLLLDSHGLSFDSRKSHKARATRRKRATKQSSQMPSLFFDALKDESPAAADGDSHTVEQQSEVVFAYLAPKRRIQLHDNSDPSELQNIFQVRTVRRGGTISIDVSRKKNRRFFEDPLLTYRLKFDHPIGDGVTRIDCMLLSNNAHDIAVAWDSIEDALSACSGFRTMMDIYGHFTEPHPIFKLEMDVTGSRSPVLRFAEWFSSFENCAKIIPGKVLTSMFADDHRPGLELSQLARFLRGLRFDVRVHETNPPIPLGYFRCCYPFTMNIHKQVSVTWKERAH
jgi:DNA (cytosine-5)-methyltransferase 1